MTEIERFVEQEGKLVKLLKIEQGAFGEGATSESKMDYRKAASEFSLEASGGLVPVTDLTPDANVNRIYVSAKQDRNDRSAGYFHEHRQQIITQLPDPKLAKQILNFPHRRVEGNRDRDSKIDLIGKYVGIKSLNQAYDSESPLKMGDREIKVDDNVLFQKASDEVNDSIDKYHKKTEDATAKYITNETKALVKDAIIAALASTPKASRLVTGKLEEQAKKDYEGVFPDDGTKAGLMRESMMLEDEGKIRKMVYTIATSE